MRKSEFEKLLIEAIAESFSSSGESPKQAILFHLENTFKIKEQEIPNKLESFDYAIKKLFGPGADFLEALILKKLCENDGSLLNGLPPKEAGFPETVASIKQIMVK